MLTKADYAFMCAFLGSAGDYSKSADALARADGWNAKATLVYWFFLFVTMPPICFAISFWSFRAPHIRAVRRKHAMKLVIEENWCSNTHGPPANTIIQVQDILVSCTAS
jgi:hypothetical protein